jgi:hypothetical protein
MLNAACFVAGNYLCCRVAAGVYFRIEAAEQKRGSDPSQMDIWTTGHSR